MNGSGLISIPPAGDRANLQSVFALVKPIAPKLANDPACSSRATPAPNDAQGETNPRLNRAFTPGVTASCKCSAYANTLPFVVETVALLGPPNATGTSTESETGPNPMIFAAPSMRMVAAEPDPENVPVGVRTEDVAGPVPTLTAISAANIWVANIARRKLVRISLQWTRQSVLRVQQAG